MLLEKIKEIIRRPSRKSLEIQHESLISDLNRLQIENDQARKKILAAQTLFALAGQDVDLLVDKARIKAEELSRQVMEKREKGNKLFNEADVLETEASQLKIAAIMMANPKKE